MNVRPSNIFAPSLLAVALALPVAPVLAQHQGHVMPPPAQAPQKPVAKPAVKPAAKKPTTAPTSVDHAAVGHGAVPAKKSPAKPVVKPASTPATVDHAAMGHGSTPTKKSPAKATKPATVDHAAMGHGPAPAATPRETEQKPAAAPTATSDTVDHAAMGHETPPSEPSESSDHSSMDHGTPEEMDHAAMGHGVDPDLPANAPPLTPIPPITEADRDAVYPRTLHGHATHDRSVHSYWLADRLEWQDTEDGSLGWEGLAWIGSDMNRLWLRTEGEASDGEVEAGNLEVLYGRGVSAWWDVVAGVRQDFGEGPSRTYAAFGFQGLAPYKFEVEATVYVGAGGRTAATLEAEYDTLITNRLIMQWLGEVSLYGKDDPANGIGSGLSTVEAGARLRYEVTRQFAPYIGVEWERAFGGTADLRREDGEPTRDTRLVAGIRFWF